MTWDSFPCSHSWASGNTVYSFGSPICKVALGCFSPQCKMKSPQACPFPLSPFSLQIYVALRTEMRTVAFCATFWNVLSTEDINFWKVIRIADIHLTALVTTASEQRQLIARQDRVTGTSLLTCISTTNSFSIAIYWLNCKPQVGRLLFPNTSSSCGLSIVISCFAQCR